MYWLKQRGIVGLREGRDYGRVILGMKQCHQRPTVILVVPSLHGGRMIGRQVLLGISFVFMFIG